MKELTQLPNIGEVLANKLISAGIKNQEELKTLGSENVFIRMTCIQYHEACINMLLKEQFRILNGTH